MPSYLSRWTASFTANRTMSFCFDNSRENPQPYNSGLPQGSPASPVLFLIYAQAMLEALAYLKDKDISYLDDDGALQLALTRQTAIRRLQERMELRLQRGAQLNLPYDLGKSGPIHLWPPRSSTRPSDASSQLGITINGTVVRPSARIIHLGAHIDDTLTFHAHVDEVAAQGRQCLARLATLRLRHRGLSTYTALHLVKTAPPPKMLCLAGPVDGIPLHTGQTGTSIQSSTTMGNWLA